MVAGQAQLLAAGCRQPGRATSISPERVFFQYFRAGGAGLSFSAPFPALITSGFSLERPQGQEAGAEGWACKTGTRTLTRLCPRLAAPPSAIFCSLPSLHRLPSRNNRSQPLTFVNGLSYCCPMLQNSTHHEQAKGWRGSAQAVATSLAAQEQRHHHHHQPCPRGKALLPLAPLLWPARAEPRAQSCPTSLRL